MSVRAASLTAFGGLLVAVLGAIGVALGDEPHLDFGHLDPWLIVYAIGLLVALGALPFPLHARYETRTEDRDKRWELALTAWGGIALAGAAGFVVFGLLAGFAPESATGALAIVGAWACALVIVGLGILVVSS